MSLLNDLVNIFHHHQQPQQTAHVQGVQSVSSGSNSVPDITYNPNPNTNVPYSAHTPALARLGNQYVANPTAPQFRGVDPALFGFPADNTAYRPVVSPVSTPDAIQFPSYNNGQVTLNGQFMQGGFNAPEYTTSPYANLNKRNIVF